MSDFIKTLKSVGGVKPCNPCGYPTAPKGPMPCNNCHGTGQILDLAPLLAKPKALLLMAFDLTMKCEQLASWYDAAIQQSMFMHEVEKNWPNLHVVGPQRASNLVYEIARQLGGTAVVYITYPWDEYEPELTPSIPPDATVLFVTDGVSQSEMFDVMEHVMTSAPKDKPHKFLPYLLALVSAYDKWEFPDPEKTQWKVISLHQEKL